MSTDIKLGWLAGIFDGEGCARIYKSKPNVKRQDFSPGYRAQVHVVSNTDPAIIAKAAQILYEFGIGHVLKRYGLNVRGKAAKPWWSECCDIRLASYSEIVKFLKLILPYCTGRKRAQCESVLAFVENRMRRPKIVGRGTKRPPEWTEEDERMFASQPLTRGREGRPLVN